MKAQDINYEEAYRMNHLLGNNLFFEILGLALGTKDCLSRNPSEEEWYAIYTMAKKQSVAGVYFIAIDRLYKDGCKPPQLLLYDWIAVNERIKAQNLLQNRRLADITQVFKEAGFESCILKGQGNALMYPDPFSRMPGDLDIWVSSKDDKLIGREKKNIIRNYVRGRCPDAKEKYHHIDFPMFKDVDVEVHYIPSYAIVPRFAKRTECFFSVFTQEDISTKGLVEGIPSIKIPSKQYNIIFQLSHMMRHFFYGGIGLRQLIDYFYLLRYTYGNSDNQEIDGIFAELGMKKFASAVMWVLSDVLGLEDKYLLVPSDKKRGQLLLDEIMKGGNFGHYDQRLAAKMMDRSTTLSIITKNLNMIKLFPEEAIWTPLTGLWQHLAIKYRGDKTFGSLMCECSLC